MSDLSEDLVEEILSRVPATSLKRLRSTCKRWNVLFNDKRFIKKHSDKATKEFLVVLFDDVCSYLTNVDLNGIHQNIDPTIQVRRRNVFGRVSLVVNNPCTEQTRWIEFRIDYQYFDKFALGYENNNNYKILRIPDSINTIPVFEIYEFNSNSWRVLDDVNPDWRVPSNYDRCVSLKGNTYWVAMNSEEPLMVDDFLLKFDFTKERFQRLRLPFKCYCLPDTVVLSTVREEQLAVLFQRRHKPTVEVWLTNNLMDLDPNDVSWSMFFRVDLGNEYMFTSSMSFIVDEENKVAVCCDTSSRWGRQDYEMTRIHIVGEGRFRRVDHLGDFAFNELYNIELKDKPFLFSYAPSLVQL